MNITREQALIEYAKCIKSTPYALRTYLQTYDNTVKKFVPLDLFSDQVKLVEDYENHEENIALKYRQAGVSTVTAAWASKKIAFAKKETPEKILIIANKLDTSVEFANKIKQFTEQWPSWMKIEFAAEKNAARHWKLTNGCEVKAVATSNDALRGYTPTVLIFDEAAYIEAGDDFWAACMASLSTGGKVIVISTPNGYDTIYYPIYDQALKGINNFKITEMFWWRDPRYTKDLQFIKVKDIIHYYLNRDEYKDVEIISYEDIPQSERNFKDFEQLMNDGYKPHSEWFEKMAKKLKFDKRKISQELECVDGDTKITIKDKLTQEIKTISIKDLYDIIIELKINNRYEILTPDGFVDFDGIQKLKKLTRELFFNDGSILRASLNHIIYDENYNEVLIKNIKKGDTILSSDGIIVVNDIIDHLNESDVFDVINSGKKHIYFTNNVISHNCNFLGSGDNVIESSLMEKIRNEMVRQPEAKMVQNQLWIWKEPVVGHKYIMGVDVSRGDSEDYTSFQIIDFDEREQVAEYLGKVPPDIAAEIAYKWGILYDAFIVVDITGGMGVSTSRKLQEMNYKNLYIDGVNYANVWEFNAKAMEKIPGINFNSKRVQIISSFEEALRHGFKVYSPRLHSELSTFVYINGRPDHMKGHHDDLIMAISMALYVGNNAYNQLEKVSEQTKALLNSWEVHNSDTSRNIREFNPGLPAMSPSSYGDKFNNNPTKGDYEKYSWLFGGRR